MSKNDMVVVEKKEFKDGKNHSGSWILEYKPYSYPDDLEKVMAVIKQKLNPKYLTPKYKEINLSNPLYGHCYHSTQCLYYFFIAASLEIRNAKCEYSGHHWWLEDKDKNIIDVTAEQYYSVGKIPPYDKGKKGHWYGWKRQPHKRSLVLMNDVQPSSRLHHHNLIT